MFIFLKFTHFTYWRLTFIKLFVFIILALAISIVLAPALVLTVIPDFSSLSVFIVFLIIIIINIYNNFIIGFSNIRANFNKLFFTFFSFIFIKNFNNTFFKIEINSINFFFNINTLKTKKKIINKNKNVNYKKV